MANKVEFSSAAGWNTGASMDAHSAVERVVDAEMRLTNEYRDAHAPVSCAESAGGEGEGRDA
jgi:hypothetical protein